MSLEGNSSCHSSAGLALEPYVVPFGVPPGLTTGVCTVTGALTGTTAGSAAAAYCVLNTEEFTEAYNKGYNKGVIGQRMLHADLRRLWEDSRNTLSSSREHVFHVMKQLQDKKDLGELMVSYL